MPTWCFYYLLRELRPWVTLTLTLHLKWLCMACDCEERCRNRMCSRQDDAYFCELMPSMVRIIRSLSSSSNLLLWDLDLGSKGGEDRFKHGHKIKVMKCCKDRVITCVMITNVVMLLAHLSRLWKWYCPIGTSWNRNQTIHLLMTDICLCVRMCVCTDCIVLTVVLILPLSVVMLSRWWRLAKGLAAPQDSRYRVILTDALIFPPSREGRERKPNRGLCLSVCVKTTGTEKDTGDVFVSWITSTQQSETL